MYKSDHTSVNEPNDTSPSQVITVGDNIIDGFNVRFYFLWVTIGFLIYIVICNIIYYWVTDYFTNDKFGKLQYSDWDHQFKLICNHHFPKIIDNAILACTYVTFGYGCYIFTIYRLSIL